MWPHPSRDHFAREADHRHDFCRPKSERLVRAERTEAVLALRMKPVPRGDQAADAPWPWVRAVRRRGSRAAVARRSAIEAPARAGDLSGSLRASAACRCRPDADQVGAGHGGHGTEPELAEHVGRPRGVKDTARTTSGAAVTRRAEKRRLARRWRSVTRSRQVALGGHTTRSHHVRDDANARDRSSSDVRRDRDPACPGTPPSAR
jgi:hypothetical protein